MNKPNIVFIFADQWRYHSFGYTGNTDIQTPNIDAFAAESTNVSNAVSNCPVCSPYRASLMTGQYPLTHGVIVNDVPVRQSSPGFGTLFKQNGYDTAFIGKWHINGQGRMDKIPENRRFGFDYWKVLECSHNYINSAYYDQDAEELSYWEGYDAYAQTDDAITYMENHRQKNLKTGRGNPFLMVLSWGPPHAPPPYLWNSPYDQYPEDVAGIYDSEQLTTRENVPQDSILMAKQAMEGYYSHCTALDRSFGKIREYLAASGLKENTLIVFTSDHGDMLGSHGLWKKQVPFEESIRIPLLMSAPEESGIPAGEFNEAVIEPQDILPTLLGITGIPVPEIIEGYDYSSYFRGQKSIADDCALLALYQPGGQWYRDSDGGPYGYTGREYRGIRTVSHTYVIDRNGPWLLFDNISDPNQIHNLIHSAPSARLAASLDSRLKQLLKERKDSFSDGDSLVKSYGYTPEYASLLNSEELEIYLSNWGYAAGEEHHE
jgi:arylsulfatase A-like enzyme